MAGIRSFDLPTRPSARLPMPNQLATKADTDSRQRTLQSQQDQFTNNRLTAERNALAQSSLMQGNMNIPRQVTDTSMTIPAGGYSPNYSGPQQQGNGGGGGGQLPPELAGRFMPLINQGTLTPPPLPPNVALGPGSFTPTDATNYQDAAFGRLKAKSGDLGKGAVQGLAAELAGRGLGGSSGTFGRGLVDRLSAATQPLADLNVAHLGEEYQASERARQLSESARLAEYQGGISQRGQNISYNTALEQLRAALLQSQYSGGISQRGQDLNALMRLY